MLVARAYRNEDLALMPPRACELEAAEVEHEFAELRMSGPAYTVWGGHFNTEPIGAAGIIVFRKGVGEAWLRGSTRMESCQHSFARIVKRNLDRAIDEHRLHRVQMTVRTDDCAALRFALWLGFEFEGTMRKLGSDGSHYAMMARVK